MRGEQAVALVTGGASGIGRAATLAFADAGARVVVADIDEDGGRETVERIDGAATFVRCSVADPDQVAGLVARVEKDFGRLDYALNNAGIEQPRAGIVDCPNEDWDRTLGVNLKGTWLLLKHELALMFRQRSGTIVNTASMTGHVAARGAAAYIASKHGILGLTKAAALEAADYGVRVNAVSPGHIATPMVDRVIEREPAKLDAYHQNTPLGRLGTPEEVAAAVVWLCSDAASFVTGSELGVDGGVLLS